MKLSYIIIYIESVPGTLSFYSKAFDIQTRFCLPTNDYGKLDLPGGTTLAFANESFVKQVIGAEQFRLNRKEDQLAAGAEISLVVDQEKNETVDAVFEKAVAAGAVMVKEPAKKPWGQVEEYVRDCNGFSVEIGTPMGGS
jgi:lactoylglutathione lyase